MNLIITRGKMIEAPEMILGGVIAGVFSGVAMMLVLMLRSHGLDMGLWYPPQMIASNFVGIEALVSGTVSILLGLLIHFTISIFWGAIYGMFWGRVQDPFLVILSGLFYGFLVWSVTTFFILPVIGEIMLARVRLDSLWWFFAHLLFGLGFVALPFIESSLAPRAVLKPCRLKKSHRYAKTIDGTTAVEPSL